MSPPFQTQVTICMLAFGAHPNLAQRVLDSIQVNCPRGSYELVVGANAVGEKTLALLNERHKARAIDRLIVSPFNLGKCAMMRQMFAAIDSEYIWWFDDDSHITEPGTLQHWLHAAGTSPESTVMWGDIGWCDHSLGFTWMEDVLGFVRTAPWYRGLPPPSWKVGGKGEFNFHGKSMGDGRWFFAFGGCWLIRTHAIRALDWPDRRLTQQGDDVFLGEAIRQQGWDIAQIRPLGIAINTESRRGIGSNIYSKVPAL